MTVQIPRIRLVAVLEDGTALGPVEVDQRDSRRAHIVLGIPEDDGEGHTRGMCWAALNRKGLTELTWAQFDATAAWVAPDGEPTFYDPTKPDGDC